MKQFSSKIKALALFLRKYANIIFTLIFAVIFVVYFLTNLEDFEALSKISIPILILLVIFKLVFFQINGLFTRSVLKAFEQRMGIKESGYLATISAIGNYFIPMRGGAGLRAVYLKNKYNFKYSHFISTLSGYYLLLLFSSSILGLLALFFISSNKEFDFISLLLFFLAALIVSMFLMFFPIPKKLLKLRTRFGIINKFLNIIEDILVGWGFITKKKVLLVELTLINLVSFLVAAIILLLEAHTLGIGLNVWEIILYVSISTFTSLASFTPGSIGIKEAILLLFGPLISLTSADILQIAVIDRGVVFFVLGAMYVLIKLLGSKKARDIFKHSNKSYD